MLKKTAVIVAHRKAGYLEENIKFLKKRGFEIITAVDEPDEDCLHITEKYGIKTCFSQKRRGKWKALNDAVCFAEGDYILFVDSDTKLIELDSGDLKRLEEFDAVEIRKEINGSNFLERLIGIDYFNMYLTSRLASIFQSCLSINGAAFIIRKDVLRKLEGFRKKINEDTDLGIRLGLGGYRVGVGGIAITRAPTDIKEWFIQRERWSLGGAEVIIENFREITKKPRLWLPYLFMFYPAIVGIFAGIIFDRYALKLLYLILPFLSLPPKLLSILMLSVFEFHTATNLFSILISFSIWSTTIIILSKKTHSSIDLSLLPIYYFFYSPLWTMLCLIAVARVFVTKLKGNSINLKDWVV
jgi:cellulose synthase/poly-beta-1,6-N-acetylglucosamine synthase-like glycosyltransferase